MSSDYKFTHNANELLSAAMSLAKAGKHVELTTLALAQAFFQEAGGVASRICAKAEVDADRIKKELVEAVQRRVASQNPAPDEPRASRGLVEALNRTKAAMQARGDQFMAADLLLRALADDRDVGAVFTAKGLTAAKIDAAIDTIRNGKPVTSEGGEGQFEALAKYGQDLTQRAESGKLDPVIGRDDEIRSAIRILARRTKSTSEDDLWAGDRHACVLAACMLLATTNFNLGVCVCA